jgi:hypothetical protein
MAQTVQYIKNFDKETFLKGLSHEKSVWEYNFKLQCRLPVTMVRQHIGILIC